ncbi:hypothetical protein BaRGS_00019788 [Batillaria attramentaria]|uniref:Uncharacterized protein n=1 Tax=Batillaria attramentaria TaxID=370345 RepID=A0ABD0KPA6_9CAEN
MILVTGTESVGTESVASPRGTATRKAGLVRGLKSPWPDRISEVQRRDQSLSGRRWDSPTGHTEVLVYRQEVSIQRD